MDFLKKMFPLSFNIPEKDTKQLVINIVIYAVISIVLGAVCGWLGSIRFVGWIFGIIGRVIGTYSTAGIVLAVLKFFDVLK